MLKSFFAALLAAALSSFAVSTTWAQAAASRPDPLDAKASVLAVAYDSPFTGYRTFVDQDVTSWKETNDTAGRIGGWRIYAKEARQPEPAATGGMAEPPMTKPLPAEAAKPAPGGHGGLRLN